MKIHKTQVESNQQIGTSTFVIKVLAVELAAEIIPGQFCNIKVSASSYPLLRRPFSVSDVEGLTYSFVDFTTSGLTHTYPESPDTPNRFRKGKLVKDLNFGVLKFDFQSKKVRMEIRGRENKVLEVWNQQY